MKVEQNEIENCIAGIWSNILGKEILNNEDSFFDLGGNSILLMKVHESLEEKFHCKINIADLFSYPTVSKLSILIKKKLAESINYCMTELPKDYLLEGNSLDCGYMQFNNYVSEDIYRALCGKAEELGTDKVAVLTAVLMKQLSAESGEKEIKILAVISEKQLCVLSADFGNSAQITCKLIQEQIKYPEKQNVMEFGQAEEFFTSCGRKFLTPVLYLSQTSRLEDSDNVFSVSFQFNECGQKIGYNCRFNPGRVDEYKMERFMEEYLALVKETLFVNLQAG